MKGSSKQKNAQAERVHFSEHKSGSKKGHPIITKGKVRIYTELGVIEAETIEEARKKYWRRAIERARDVAAIDSAETVKVDVDFSGQPAAPACGCDICRGREEESKRLDEVLVFEVWNSEARFFFDDAQKALAFASSLDVPVRIRSKRIPGIQYLELQR